MHCFRLEFLVMARTHKHTHIFIPSIHDIIYKRLYIHRLFFRRFLIIHRLIRFCVLRNPRVHRHVHKIQSLHPFTSWESTPPKCRVLILYSACAQLLRIEGVACSAQWIPTAVNFGFLYRSRYFSIQVAPQLSSRGWVDPFPDPLFLRNLIAPGIEPGTLDL
jgi:hypothetical protein